MPFSPLAMIPAALAFCSLVYYFLCLIAAQRFASAAKVEDPVTRDAGLKAVSTNAAVLPPASLLKPLKGCDPEMYESLRSHCVQEYPQFEIIFGVNDAADEAIPYVERLKQEFPQRAISLFISKEILGANRKVSNLAQMLREAKYEHVLINDGDIRVPANYLRDVMSKFAAPGKKVGMVTCLYRGIAGKHVWSKLEAMGINVDFMAGVLTAKLLEGDVHFALGSTMATTKEAIASIGGLETLVDNLADDYELGKRISERGYRAVIARPVVETFLPDYSFREFLDHQLRWGRTVRSSRPGGYFGMITTFGPFWALLVVLLDRNVFPGAPVSSPGAWVLLFGLIGGKALVTWATGKRVIGDSRALPNLLLLPLREIVTPAVWLMSWFGNKIVWRGETFTLRDGKLYR